MRTLIKALFRAIFLLLALPFAAATGFGRMRAAFSFFAQAIAIFPGDPGSYLRAAFYRLTLHQADPDTRIEMGSYFAHPDVNLGPRVSVGSYCVLGKVSIGARTLLASQVQIASGSQQHIRSAQGRLEDGVYRKIQIGEDVWIGAGAIILADIGDRSTIAAGAVVIHPVPPDSIFGGNPARNLKPPSTPDSLTPPS